MSKRLVLTGLALAAAGAGLLAARGLGAGEAERPAEAPKKIRVAVVTGGHGYDQKAFPRLFEGHDDIAAEFKPQKDHSELFEDVADWPHDVLVLYNMTQKISEKRQENFVALLERGMGLVVLHHALGAFQDWPEYEKIIGARYYLKETEAGGVKHERSVYKHDVDFKVRVEDPEHPITRGLADFTIHDETYGKWAYGPDNRLLLSTDEPTSNRQLGWVRTYRKSRVFTLQLGHDAKAWENENFRRILSQGIRWAAGRLPAADKDKAPAAAPAAPKEGGDP